MNNSVIGVIPILTCFIIIIALAILKPAYFIISLAAILCKVYF